MTYYTDDAITLHLGDSFEVLQGMTAGTVDCCVTSPPYFGLRDYGTPGQYGLEASPAEYVERMRRLFAEVRRVLADHARIRHRPTVSPHRHSPRRATKEPSRSSTPSTAPAPPATPPRNSAADMWASTSTPTTSTCPSAPGYDKPHSSSR
jgi:site-specific DNA-methyltransferase (cytosine-N4-specific)